MSDMWGFGLGADLDAKSGVHPARPDPPELSDQLWYGFQGDYAWDVGSNCGQAILEMNWAFDKITGFEPDPGSCYYAQVYVKKMLPAHDVKVFQYALSDTDGEIELAYPAKEQKETGQLVTIGTAGMEWEPKDWDKVEKVTVQSRRADTLLEEFGWPDFMKVDTEGHEFKVLTGATTILARGTVDMLVEFHTPQNQALCRELLLGSGYKVELVRHPHYPPESKMYEQHGWLRAFAPDRAR